MLDVRQFLFDRLKQQGVDPNDAPPFHRDLSKILESNLGIDPIIANSKLRLVGHVTCYAGLSVVAVGTGVDGIENLRQLPTS